MRGTTEAAVDAHNRSPSAHGDTGWIEASLQNSWVQYDAGTHIRARYRKKAGIVYVQGLVKNGTITTGTVIFTLPAEHRPAGYLVSVQQGDLGLNRVDVYPNGDVVCIAVSGNGYLSVNFTFPADL